MIGSHSGINRRAAKWLECSPRSW